MDFYKTHKVFLNRKNKKESEEKLAIQEEYREQFEKDNETERIAKIISNAMTNGEESAEIYLGGNKEAGYKRYEINRILNEYNYKNNCVCNVHKNGFNYIVNIKWDKPYNLLRPFAYIVMPILTVLSIRLLWKFFMFIGVSAKDDTILNFLLIIFVFLVFVFGSTAMVYITANLITNTLSMNKGITKKNGKYELNI